MSYTRDYIFEKIIEKLPTLKIHERREKDSSVFILEYEKRHARIDIDSFIRRLGDVKTQKSDKKVEEFIYYIVQNFKAQDGVILDNITKEDLVDNIYPIVRSSGFDKDNKNSLIKYEHTNETNVYLAYDFKNGYKLLNEELIKPFGLGYEELFSLAKLNLEKLPLKYNLDEVAGNKFYFLNAKDGYDGARILDKKLLDYFYNKIGSDYYMGLPHQDTLIIADIKNKKGLEILQKMMVHFFTEGLVPITTITFKYNGKDIESYFIFVD
ncbi:DUF1444 family protein [Gemella cuniculi]|uniref:DUF1444 family protein n=1 Tax=Gemella cuniculi TaxID=150240 RepID=UPI00040BF78F|nr:DUF1444 family protein [Gemella cuniculi]